MGTLRFKWWSGYAHMMFVKVRDRDAVKCYDFVK